MYLRVTVTPGARKESCQEEKSGKFLIAVKEKAEGNQANARVRDVLAHHLHIPKNKLRIVTGHKSRNKRFEVVQ